MTLDLAVRAGESLVANALWHEGRCTWIDRSYRDPLDDGTPAYGPLGPDLYDGTAGVAWFLGCLHSATGEEEFRRHAIGAIRQSLFGHRQTKRAGGLSFYVGAVGVAFAAIELGRRLDCAEIEDDGRAILRQLVACRRVDSPVDVVTGASGGIPALLVLARRLRDDPLFDLAIRVADSVLRRADRSARGWSWRSPGPKRRNLTGFSHGAAGIAYALIELFAATGEHRFRRAAERAFDYERTWFDAARGNWPDFREAGHSFCTFWCHGAPGIALSRVRAFEVLKDDRYRSEARVALATTRSALLASLESTRGGFSLCHGLAGNAEILYECSEDGDHPDPLVVRAAREAGERARSRRPGAMSFFLGVAGVGYLTLRLHDSRFPSLLLLRPDRFA